MTSTAESRGRQLPPTEVERLTRRGMRLAQFTVAYNVVEGVLSVGAGLAAGLVSLVGFGFDSAIESTIAVLVALQLAARLRHGQADEKKERRTLKAISITFFLLAAYIVIESIRSLVGDETPGQSPLGIGILIASVISMPILAAAKRRVGHALGGDPLILADAAETQICAYLSLSLLASLGLFALTGAAWLDPLAGFLIAAYAVYEGREAWEGELVEDEGSDDD